MLRFRETKIDYERKTVTLVYQHDNGHKMEYTYGLDFGEDLGYRLTTAKQVYDSNKDEYGSR